MSRALSHLTLTTGHMRASPRSEVGEDIIAKLTPILCADGGELYGLHIAIERRDPDGIVYSLGFGPKTSVVCYLAPRSSPRLWQEAVSSADSSAGGVAPGLAEPPAPWLAVIVLLPIVAEDLDRVAMLGDAERCIAWTLLEQMTH